MSKGPHVRDIELHAADPRLAGKGLVCWVGFSLAGLRFHDVELRRTRLGKFTLSWPRVRGREMTERCAVHPLNDQARLALEDAIVAEARRQGIVQ